MKDEIIRIAYNIMNIDNKEIFPYIDNTNIEEAIRNRALDHLQTALSLYEQARHREAVIDMEKNPTKRYLLEKQKEDFLDTAIAYHLVAKTYKRLIE